MTRDTRYRYLEAEALCEPRALPSIKYEQVTVLAAMEVGLFCGSVTATDVPDRETGLPETNAPVPPLVPKTLAGV